MIQIRKELWNTDYQRKRDQISMKIMKNQKETEFREIDSE